jgi:hypothetical protein
MAIVRDKLWIFGARAHQDDIYLYNSPETTTTRPTSRITPAEAALMLDVPNILMINCDGVPAPFSDDAYGYMESFCRMQQVLWNSTGSSGFRVGNEEAFICELAERFPNVVGTYMDDLFLRFSNEPDPAGKCAAFMKEVRDGLDKAPRKMDIYVTWYTHDMDVLDESLMQYIDGLTLWTWKSKELPLLEERVSRIARNFPNKKKLLGIYLYDFSARKAVPIELMEHQCEVGLRLLKEKKIDGMVFEANTVMGVGLPSELWLREWLEKVKYIQIPD